MEHSCPVLMIQVGHRGCVVQCDQDLAEEGTGETISDSLELQGVAVALCFQWPDSDELLDARGLEVRQGLSSLHLLKEMN